MNRQFCQKRDFLHRRILSWTHKCLKLKWFARRLAVFDRVLGRIELQYNLWFPVINDTARKVEQSVHCAISMNHREPWFKQISSFSLHCLAEVAFYQRWHSLAGSYYSILATNLSILATLRSGYL